MISTLVISLRGVYMSIWFVFSLKKFKSINIDLLNLKIKLNHINSAFSVSGLVDFLGFLQLYCIWNRDQIFFHLPVW